MADRHNASRDIEKYQVNLLHFMYITKQMYDFLMNYIKSLYYHSEHSLRRNTQCMFSYLYMNIHLRKLILDDTSHVFLQSEKKTICFCRSYYFETIIGNVIRTKDEQLQFCLHLLSLKKLIIYTTQPTKQVIFIAINNVDVCAYLWHI